MCSSCSGGWGGVGGWWGEGGYSRLNQPLLPSSGSSTLNRCAHPSVLLPALPAVQVCYERNQHSRSLEDVQSMADALEAPPAAYLVATAQSLWEEEPSGKGAAQNQEGYHRARGLGGVCVWGGGVGNASQIVICYHNRQDAVPTHPPSSGLLLCFLTPCFLTPSACCHCDAAGMQLPTQRRLRP